MSQEEPRHRVAPGSLLEVTLLTSALILSPVVVFLRFHGYRPIFAEGLLVASVGVLALAGAAITRRRPLVRALMLSTLTAGLVDLSFDIDVPVPGIGTSKLLVGVFLVSFLLLRVRQRLIMRVGAVIGATVLGSSLLMPPQYVAFDAGQKSGRPATLAPLLVHVMLDEHLGIEGLESQVGDPEIANETRSFLEEAGFRVFGGTYSHEMWTVDSLARLFNFDGRSAKAVVDPTGRFQHELTRNGYFDRLVEAGHTLRVLQTSFVNLCPPSLSAVCRTYDIRKLNTVEFGRLPLPVRLNVLSFLFTNQSAIWRDVRRSVDTGWGPPGEQPVLVSTLTAMEIMNDLTSRLRTASAGEAHFAHIMLPHNPYVYDRDCHVRLLEDWLDRVDPTLPDLLKNTEEGRGRRYALYVDQMRCVRKRLDQALEAIPEDVARDAIVIVHGDHGSRIVEHEPAHKLAKDSDHISAFSTLFAVRAPGVAAGYQSDQVWLSCLFQGFVEAGFQSPPQLSVCKRAEPVFGLGLPLGVMPRLSAGR